MLLIRAAEVEGVRVDVRVAGGRVVALGAGLAGRPGEVVIEAAGGALLPGLHDHHLHLLAWAAARIVAEPRKGPDRAAERAQRRFFMPMRPA